MAVAAPPIAARDPDDSKKTLLLLCVVVVGARRPASSPHNWRAGVGSVHAEFPPPPAAAAVRPADLHAAEKDRDGDHTAVLRGKYDSK